MTLATLGRPVGQLKRISTARGSHEECEPPLDSHSGCQWGLTSLGYCPRLDVFYVEGSPAADSIQGLDRCAGIQTVSDAARC